MKERREAKDREEEAKRKESGMCLSHPLCRAVTMTSKKRSLPCLSWRA